MLELEVELFNWKTLESEITTFPCNLKDHEVNEFSVANWKGSFTLGTTSIKELNDLLEKINSENDMIDHDIIEAILNELNVSLTNKKFVEKLCSHDYFLEEVPQQFEREEVTEEEMEGLAEFDIEEAAAHLLTKFRVSYAKNINDHCISLMARGDIDVDWFGVWRHYEHMGFRLIYVNDIPYIFHWGDIEK